MSSSLLLGTFDLLSTTSQVRLGKGWGRGNPNPQTTDIETALLDGARVTGARSGNRQITMPLFIDGTSRLDLATQVNKILTTVDAASWPLTWTPQGGLPVIYDCFRATAVPTSNLNFEAGFNATYLLTFEALPFGRSDAPVALTLAAPATVQIDAYENTTNLTSVSYGNSTGVSQALITTPIVEGSKALEVSYSTPAVVPSLGGATVQRTGLNISLTGMATIQVWAELFLVSDDDDFISSQTWALTVTGVSNTVYPVPTVLATPKANPNTSYKQIAFNLAGVGLAENIKSYALTPAGDAGGSGAQAMKFRLDDLRAYPSTTGGTTDGNGTTYSVNGVIGTARTTAGLALSTSFGTQGVVIHRVPADTPTVQPLVVAAGTLPQTPTVTGSKYFGTYGLWLAVNTFTNTSARTYTVAVQQNTAASSNVGSVSVVSAPYTPGASGAGNHALVYIGDVTLPVVDIPDEGTAGGSYAFAVTGSINDTIYGLLLLDSRGDSIVYNDPSGGTGSKNVWVDEPDPTNLLGAVLVAKSGAPTRTDAFSGLGNVARISGAGPLSLEPGSDRLLIYCLGGALGGTLTYTPRWLQERSQ